MYHGKEYKDLDKCPKCEAPRYKDVKNDSRTKGGPVKVAWYFPVHPRLERLFANAETAKLLRWHEEGRRKDKMLRHPAVGSDWRSIDFMFKKNFGYGARNIMFGLSTDGMNPFDMVRTNHSSWPMMICIYNLPPWLCMKRAYLQLAVMIQGPKQPGNDIDVYLEPLMDDLQKLWNDGLTVWDEYTKKHYLVKGMLLNTITDLPGRGCLSGEATKGYHGCVECLDETVAKWLPNSNKMVYMGHHRGLLRHHPYHRDKESFDGTEEHRQLPKYRDRKQIFKEVSKLKVALGKGKEKVPAPAGSLWKKISIFWKLSYWKHLTICHSLDPMNITKNICASTLGTLLATKGESKDSIKSRMDLEQMGVRPELHPITLEDGTNKLPVASWTISKGEKEKLLSFFDELKVPTGYCANLKRLVNMKQFKLNISGMKAHDYHVMMTQLLPIALRGILPDKVRDPIIKLCSFFNAVS